MIQAVLQDPSYACYTQRQRMSRSNAFASTSTCVRARINIRKGAKRPSLLSMMGKLLKRSTSTARAVSTSTWVQIVKLSPNPNAEAGFSATVLFIHLPLHVPVPGKKN